MIDPGGCGPYRTTSRGRAGAFAGVLHASSPQVNWVAAPPGARAATRRETITDRDRWGCPWSSTVTASGPPAGPARARAAHRTVDGCQGLPERATPPLLDARCFRTPNRRAARTIDSRHETLLAPDLHTIGTVAHRPCRGSAGISPARHTVSLTAIGVGLSRPRGVELDLGGGGSMARSTRSRTRRGTRHGDARGRPRSPCGRTWERRAVALARAQDPARARRRGRPHIASSPVLGRRPSSAVCRIGLT